MGVGRRLETAGGCRVLTYGGFSNREHRPDCRADPIFGPGQEARWGTEVRVNFKWWSKSICGERGLNAAPGLLWNLASA